MPIGTPGFNVQQLDPAQLLTGREEQAGISLPGGLEFDDFFKLMQMIEMRKAGETTATGGADDNPDSPIMEALLGMPGPTSASSAQIRGDIDPFTGRPRR